MPHFVPAYGVFLGTVRERRSQYAPVVEKPGRAVATCAAQSVGSQLTGEVEENWTVLIVVLEILHVGGVACVSEYSANMAEKSLAVV